MGQSVRRATTDTWRVRFYEAVGLTLILAAMILIGVVRTEWAFAAVVAPGAAIAAARVWLIFASHQPVSYLGTVVILLNGPRRFIAESGIRGRDGR